jgi:stage II sporulation protein P
MTATNGYDALRTLEGKPSPNLILTDFSMPVLKSSALSEDELAEYDFSYSDKLLELLGLDVTDPLSVIGKELSLFTPTDTQVATNEIKPSFSINPFKLADKSITKHENPNSSSGGNVTAPVANVSKVYDPTLKKTLNSSKPEVLIYHTHTTESFRPTENTPDKDYEDNTMDETKNIVGVGDVLADDLEKNYGISVIHDKTVHNTIFLQSYARSGKTVDTYLNKYKDLKLIIDLHRNSIEDKTTVTASMNNNKLAKYMFVIGPGNPNKDKNITLTKKLSSISQTLFPGLLLPGNGADFGIYYHKPGNKFNQQKSGNLVLIEVGSQVNTIDEAKTTSLYLSRIIAEYINRK